MSCYTLQYTTDTLPLITKESPPLLPMSRYLYTTEPLPLLTRSRYLYCTTNKSLPLHHGATTSTNKEPLPQLTKESQHLLPMSLFFYTLETLPLIKRAATSPYQGVNTSITNEQPLLLPMSRFQYLPRSHHLY